MWWGANMVIHLILFCYIKHFFSGSHEVVRPEAACLAPIPISRLWPRGLFYCVGSPLPLQIGLAAGTPRS